VTDNGLSSVPWHRTLAAAALVVLSAVYYSLYINAGFNYTDDGNYAQTAYELFLGRAPQDIALSYGLLWFKAGEVLFHLFGVNFLLVRLLFFAVITLTSVLVFHTVAAASKSLPLAAVFAGVVALAPAFPATSFYGLCVLLNAAAQIRLTQRMERGAAWDGALAGAALAFSFQIRPDFGFIFAAPLAAILLLLRWPINHGRAHKVLGGAVLGFVCVSVPAAAIAIAGGYGSMLIHQYIDYPVLLIGLLLNGLRGLGQADAATAITVLHRPGAGEPTAAALVYLPLVTFTAFGAFILLTLRSRLRAQPARLAQALVALTTGISTFPHYFFFRPDLSHIANFMPGFVLMTAVFLTGMRDDLKAPVPAKWLRPFATACGVLIAAHLALYTWVGLASPATGSIGMAHGRTEAFHAENGVNVRVAPDELQQLTTLRDTITANSGPGDAIVCVPYCPGLVFMTARRMLLDNFYVDDSYLVLRPQWLPAAIAQTRAAHPRVAIVQDWAINGTERSRFANWAASYVEVLKEQARAEIPTPGVTIYIGTSP
jgi:hypothetical protein